MVRRKYDRLEAKIANLSWWPEVSSKVKGFPSSPVVHHFNPAAFLEQMRRVEGGYQKGDKGKVVLEINFRLAGFGGLLPTEEYTELTEKGVKQFQRDYMKMANPSGVVDSQTLEAIDDFSEKYRENLNDYKCKCGVCSGFGNRQFKNEYTKELQIEAGHKYEYPGIHQSLLWAVSASRFYFTEQLGGKFSIMAISSGYRCWEHSITKSKKTTNHMGKAVDILFNKNGERTRESDDMDELREKIYCDFIGAPKQGGNDKTKFGWLACKFGLESTSQGAPNWVHLDVREFDPAKYLKDVFFIKSTSDKCFNNRIS